MSLFIPGLMFGPLETSHHIRIIILFFFFNLCISYCWFSKINKLKKPSCTFEALTISLFKSSSILVCPIKKHVMQISKAEKHI